MSVHVILVLCVKPCLYDVCGNCITADPTALQSVAMWLLGCCG